MRFVLKNGLAAVALLALSAPAFALNPQPEPPGVNHDPNVSIQHSNPTLTTQVSANCGAASGAPNVTVGGTAAATNMSARPASGGATGAALNAGVASNDDKCAKAAGGMNAAATAAPAATPAH